MTAWLIVSGILGVLWMVLLCLFVGTFAAIAIDGNNPFKEEEIQVFGAFLFVGAFFVLFHWIILLSLIPFVMLYGMVQTFKLARKRVKQGSLTSTE